MSEQELLGHRLGGWKLTRKLGEGGFGSVYVGEPDVGPARAIKVLHDVSQVDAIRKEAEVLTKLRHPNVVQLIQASVSEDPPFLVTELVQGVPLSDLVPLPFEHALPVCQQILAGLAHAHERGVAHLDLKPANVLVERNTRGWIAKVTDFGLARAQARRSELEMSFLKTDPGVSGTPAYMAPEQREGKPGDARADVFSFGVLLCEVLTGRRPQPGDTLEELLDRPAPRWAQVAFEGCYTRYDRRFTSAGAVLRAVNEGSGRNRPVLKVTIPKSPPIVITADSISSRPSPPARRRPQGPFCRGCGTAIHPRTTRCPSCRSGPRRHGPYCGNCGAHVYSHQLFCIRCHSGLRNPPRYAESSKLACILLAIFLPIGVHRLLMGYTLTGLLQMFMVFCWVGILWAWADAILMLMGELEPEHGWGA